VSWEEALRDLAHLLSRPALRSHPPLTPALWAAMSCRRSVAEGRPVSAVTCACPFCALDREQKPAKANREAEDQCRPHVRHAFPFGSVGAALEHYVRSSRGGGDLYRSSAGSLAAMRRDVLALGTAVQTTVRSRDPMRRLDDVIAIGRALDRVASEPDVRGPVATGDACDLLLASVDAHWTATTWAERLSLSERAVGRLLGRARRRLGEALHEADLVPAPRPRRRRVGGGVL